HPGGHGCRRDRLHVRDAERRPRRGARLDGGPAPRRRWPGDAADLAGGVTVASYSDYQSKLAPPWLQGPNGLIIQQGLGAEKDDFLDRTRQGVLSNFPDQGPTDALPHIGADWVLPQADGESDDDYRERLRTAWDSESGWSFAGSHGSLLRALDRAGFPMGTPD